MDLIQYLSDLDIADEETTDEPDAGGQEESVFYDTSPSPPARTGPKKPPTRAKQKEPTPTQKKLKAPPPAKAPKSPKTGKKDLLSPDDALIVPGPGVKPESPLPLSGGPVKTKKTKKCMT